MTSNKESLALCMFHVRDEQRRLVGNNGRARGPESRRNIVGNVRENNEHESGVVQLTVFIPATSAWGIKSKHARYLCKT